MNKYKIELKGVAVELVLGDYMPTDTTILNNWEEFYHYNNLLHVSQLIPEHLTELSVFENNQLIFKNNSHLFKKVAERSFSPVMIQDALYLRTECAENAIFSCELEADGFDFTKIQFHTQDYDGLFRTGKSFLSFLSYENLKITPEWQSGIPIGNICLVCRFENGYLIPEYDAIKKVSSK